MDENRKELLALRVALARVAQACGPQVAIEIPGAAGRLELVFSDLCVCADQHERGWNRLAAIIIDTGLRFGADR